jgi:hypothetical protein
MAGERSATLVLTHETMGEPEAHRGLIGYTTKIPFERYTTEALVEVDGDREETDVVVECGGCDKPVVAHLLGPRAFRRQRLRWAVPGLAVLAAQLLIVVLFIRSLGDPDMGGDGFFIVAVTAVVMTSPVGLLLLSSGVFHPGILRTRRPKDGVHTFRLQRRKGRLTVWR